MAQRQLFYFIVSMRILNPPIHPLRGVFDSAQFSVETSFSTTNIATPRKTNMTMEKQPFEDVFSVKKCDFPLPC